MADESQDAIRRLHDAINKHISERLKHETLIRRLRTDNLRLRQELHALRASHGGAAASPPPAKEDDAPSGGPGGYRVG